MTRYLKNIKIFLTAGILSLFYSTALASSGFECLVERGALAATVGPFVQLAVLLIATILILILLFKQKQQKAVKILGIAKIVYLVIFILLPFSLIQPTILEKFSMIPLAFLNFHIILPVSFYKKAGFKTEQIKFYLKFAAALVLISILFSYLLINYTTCNLPSLHD